MPNKTDAVKQGDPLQLLTAWQVGLFARTFL